MGQAEATLIGMGAMVGAGIFVVTGIAAGAAGPALILVFALNGVVALHVVKVPRQLPRSEGREFLDRAEPLFEAAVKVGEKMKTPVYGALWVSSDVQNGVLEAIAEKRPSLVVLGWRGQTRARARFFGTTLDPVLLQARTDVLLLRWRDKQTKFANVVVGVTASPHAQLGVDIAKALERQLKAKCRYLHVLKRGTPMDGATERVFLGDDAKPEQRIDLEIVQGRTTAAGIIEASKEADLRIMGAAREGILNQLVFGAKTRTIARRARCAVLLAKRRPGPGLSLLRRLFTRQS